MKNAPVLKNSAKDDTNPINAGLKKLQSNFSDSSIVISDDGAQSFIPATDPKFKQRIQRALEKNFSYLERY